VPNHLPGWLINTIVPMPVRPENSVALMAADLNLLITNNLPICAGAKHIPLRPFVMYKGKQWVQLGAIDANN
jgi:hypothetical protein